MKVETYEEFVKKYEPKKTTDDCYTPPAIYEAVKNWAVKHYDWGNRPIVRPFWPGGDYENFEYPENCVVIDNPPFSIVSKIVGFYEEKGIDYFLFAPGLTTISIKKATSHICVGAPVTYENKAKVPTSFVASQGPAYMTEPDLYKIIENICLKMRKVPPKKVTYWRYPVNFLKSADFNYLSKLGINYKTDNYKYVRNLFTKAGEQKSIFGSGIVIDEKEGIMLKREKDLAIEKIGGVKTESCGPMLHLPKET